MYMTREQQMAIAQADLETRKRILGQCEKEKGHECELCAAFFGALMGGLIAFFITVISLGSSWETGAAVHGCGYRQAGGWVWTH